MATRSTSHHIPTSPQSDCNTPWWYQTPSLASQTTYTDSSQYLSGHSQANYPFSITPTQSSGYFDDSTVGDEDSGSMLTNSTSAATYGHQSSTEGSGNTDWSGRGGRLSHVLQNGPGGGAAHHVCRQCQPHGTVEEQPSSLCTHNSQLTSPVDNSEYGFTVNSSIYVSPGSTSCGENTSPHPGDALTDSTTGAVDFTGTLVSECSPNSTLTSVFDSTFEENQRVRVGYSGMDSPRQHQGVVPHGSALIQAGGSYVDKDTGSQSYSGASQLSHAMSSAEQEVLHYLAPQLMQHMNSADLLPLLKQYNLLNEEDVEYIQSPHRSEKERRQRILNAAPFSSPGAFECFIECLSRETSHSGHAYLARRMREALERKKENPFKRLSSLRSNNKRPSPSSLRSDITTPTFDQQQRIKKSPQTSRVHQNIPSSTSPGPSTSNHNSVLQNQSGLYNVSYIPREPVILSSTTSTRPHNYETLSYTNRQPSLSSSLPRNEHEQSVISPLTSGSNTSRFYFDESHLTWDSQPGDCSSFPRQIMQQSRGTRAYSSARYSTSSTSDGSDDHHRRKKVARNASFSSPTHHSSGVSNLVSPLARHPSTVHEEDLSGTNDSAYYSTSTTHSVNNSARKLSFPGPGPSAGFSRGSGMERGQLGSKSTSGGQIPTKRSEFEIGTSMMGGVSGPRGNEGQGYMHGPPQQFPSASLTDDHFSTQNTQQSMQSRLSYISACSEHPHSSPSPGGPGGPRYPQAQQTLSSSYTNFGSNFNPLSSIDSSTQSDSLQSTQQSHSTNTRSPSKGLSWVKVHRRSRSCDASKSLERDQLTLSMEKSRHHSLKRKSSASSDPRESQHYGGGSFMSQPVTVPPSTASIRHSSSNVELLRGSQSGLELSNDTLSFTRRRLQWLQEKINFTDFYEDVFFDSLTHYEQNRDILYSGTLYERGKPRFMVLLTDMLLILKPKKKTNIVQSKIGRGGIHLDWFSDQECKTRKPLMLHLLSVQRKGKKQNIETFYIHYNRDSTMVEICLQAVSKAAKEIWVDALEEAIRCCTKAHAESLISVGQQVRRKPSITSSTLKLTLTVVEANNLALLTDTKTKNHFCIMELGGHKCRTPSIRAKCWPTWNFKCDFTDFELSDVLQITFLTERTVCPDDFLGFVNVNLMSLLRKQPGNTNKLLFRNQSFSLQQGKGTITLHLELSLDVNLM